MLRIKSIVFVGLFVVFAVAPVTAQTTVMKTVRHEISDGKLKVDFEYEQDATAFVNSKLIYQKFISSGADGGLQPLSFTNSLAADRTRFTFVIPSEVLKDAIAIEFFMELTDSQIRFRSPASRVDVKYLSDLNQARKENVTLSDENQNLNGKITELNGTIATLSAKIIPNSVFLAERKMLSDDKVILLFGTNVAGKIRATIKGPDGFSKPATSKVVSDRHLIEFTGLQAGGGEYIVEAIALNVNDGDKEIPTVKVTFDTNPNLKFRTPSEPINRPTLTINAESKNPSSIDVAVTLDQKGFIEVTCEERPDVAKGIKGRLRQIGKLGVSEFGMPTGQPMMAETKVFSCDELNPNALHIVTVKAVNEVGKPSLVPTLTTAVTTKQPPQPFEFADALNIEMGPLGITMKWSATTAPDTDTSFLDVLFDNDDFKVTKKADVSGTSFTAQLSSLDELVSVINKSLTTKKQPVFRVRMKQGNTERVRLLRVAFVLPKKEVVENSGLSTEAKNQVLDVLKNAKDGGSVNWAKLLKSGLSLIAKVVL